MDKEVHIEGIGGLGNCLFPISYGIYFAENFGYKIKLIYCSEFDKGTYVANNIIKRNKKDNDGIVVGYKDTILKYFEFTNKIHHYDLIISSHFSTDLPIPNENHTKILISHYSMNFNVIQNILTKIPKYLNLNDTSRFEYIKNKYNIKLNDINILLGIRMCKDFPCYLTCHSYENALHTVLNLDNKINDNYNLIILADDKNNYINKLNFKISGKMIFIDEDDIDQIYAGLLCNYIILSESTYHYWIALLKYALDNNTNVLGFNSYQGYWLVNHKFYFDDWIILKN